MATQATGLFDRHDTIRENWDKVNLRVSTNKRLKKTKMDHLFESIQKLEEEDKRIQSSQTFWGIKHKYWNWINNGVAVFGGLSAGASAVSAIVENAEYNDNCDRPIASLVTSTVAACIALVYLGVSGIQTYGNHKRKDLLKEHEERMIEAKALKRLLAAYDEYLDEKDHENQKKHRKKLKHFVQNFDDLPGRISQENMRDYWVSALICELPEEHPLHFKLSTLYDKASSISRSGSAESLTASDSEEGSGIKKLDSGAALNDKAADSSPAGCDEGVDLESQDTSYHAMFQDLVDQLGIDVNFFRFNGHCFNKDEGIVEA